MARKPRKVGADADHWAAGMPIDLKPFMNVIIVLIPMLLMSAEFARTAILELKLPEGRGSSTEVKQTVAPTEDKSNKMLLTLIVTDSVVTIGAKGGFLPSIYYREFHHYISRVNRKDTIVRFDPQHPEPPLDPATGKRMTINERYDIWLYAVDQATGKVKNCLYNKYGQMVTDIMGNGLTAVKGGDTAFVMSNPRKMVIVSDPAEYVLKQQSAYDELQNRLMKIKERFIDVDDKDDIIIAAENGVFYDKIIQLMDVAKSSNYPNIMIAKLRA
ncbi:MAG: biopolymer transporter ExbD [Chitinivibrionales bacterium]|nr:biopolymer transporter ExbD [Chitinivibrionales bacterium]